MHLGLRQRVDQHRGAIQRGREGRPCRSATRARCAPNACTSSPVRTPGSAKLPSPAVHVCAITGHGHDAAPHEVSEVLGLFQVTVYGVAGPWIDDDGDLRRIAFSALIRFAVSVTLSR